MQFKKYIKDGFNQFVKTQPINQMNVQMKKWIEQKYNIVLYNIENNLNQFTKQLDTEYGIDAIGETPQGQLITFALRIQNYSKHSEYPYNAFNMRYTRQGYTHNANKTQFEKRLLQQQKDIYTDYTIHCYLNIDKKICSIGGVNSNELLNALKQFETNDNVKKRYTKLDLDQQQSFLYIHFNNIDCITAYNAIERNKNEIKKNIFNKYFKTAQSSHQ